jgi:hypothetical protein
LTVLILPSNKVAKAPASGKLATCSSSTDS